MCALLGVAIGLESCLQTSFWAVALPSLVFACLSEPTRFFDRPMFGAYDIVPSTLSRFHTLMTVFVVYGRLIVGVVTAPSGLPYMYLVWGGVLVGVPRLVAVTDFATDSKARGNSAFAWVACFADLSTLHYVLALDSLACNGELLRFLFFCFHCAQWVPCLLVVLHGHANILDVTQGFSTHRLCAARAGC